MTQDEFKNLTTEEMLSVARQDYKTTSPDFQQATGLDFSYTTMVNIIKERGYVRSGKQWLPLPKDSETNTNTSNDAPDLCATDPLIDNLRTLSQHNKSGKKKKLFELDTELDKALVKLSAQNWPINLSQGTLINIAILRLIDDIETEKLGVSYDLKSRLSK